MAIPMPIFERFARGTRWILKGDCIAGREGTIVTIVDPPYEEVNEMYVRVTLGGRIHVVPLSLLG